jgi:hypothetical protein
MGIAIGVVIALLILGFGTMLVALGRLRQSVDTLQRLEIETDVQNRILHTVTRRYLGSFLDPDVTRSHASDEAHGVTPHAAPAHVTVDCGETD